MTKKKVLILGVVFVLIITLTGCGKNEKDSEKNNNTYEVPVEHFTNAMQNADYKELKKAFPSFVNMTIDKDDWEDVCDQFADKYGDDYKITYEITNKEELTDSDIKKEQKSVKELYGEKVEITKGYKVKVSFKVKGSEGKDTDKKVFNVYEIDGSWYLLSLG